MNTPVRGDDPALRPEAARSRPTVFSRFTVLVLSVFLLCSCGSSKKPDPAVQAEAETAAHEELMSKIVGGNVGRTKTELDPKSVRFRLDLGDIERGMPLDDYGEDLAVVQGAKGQNVMGLNGVDGSVAEFPGCGLRNFELRAGLSFNFPVGEGMKPVSKTLLTMRLGESTRRKLKVEISQPEYSPPLATFSMGGPKLAPSMYCSPSYYIWETMDPVELVVTNAAGALRISYDGHFICTSPLDPSLKLRDFSIPLESRTLLNDVVLAESNPWSQAKKAPAEKKHALPDDRLGKGVTRINISRYTEGGPVPDYGDNLICLRDDEGKYLATSSPKGANVFLGAQTGDAFSVEILIKNEFPLSDKPGRTGRFFLFTLFYENDVKEVFSINLTRDDEHVWKSRYHISGSGQGKRPWTTSTDYRPWDNAIDFNEYKIVKSPDGLLRFFFNGEFVRNEKTKGDRLAGVKAPIRANDRLYDIVIKNLPEKAADKKKKAKKNTKDMKERDLNGDEDKDGGARARAAAEREDPAGAEEHHD